MFQNQTFRQKLSYSRNDDNNDVVTINITLSTNHEIKKEIIKDIEDNISLMFLENYTNTEDLIIKRNLEQEKLKQEKIRLKEQQRMEALAEKNRLLMQQQTQQFIDSFKKPNRR